MSKTSDYRLWAGGIMGLGFACAAQALDLDVSAGDFWEYVWTNQSIDVVQGSSTSVDITTGRFRVTLGMPVSIAGEQAYPLMITGETGDSEIDYRPRWSHIVAAADGSILGSVDGSTLAPALNATDVATSLGFLVEFPESAEIEQSTEPFEANFNTLSGLALRRRIDPQGCTFYPSIGTEVCPGDETDTTIQETEFFKDGLGPIGVRQYVNVTSSGGGFFTSFTDDRILELVATSLTASDGSVIKPPPWNPRAGLVTPRYRHGAAAHQGRIFVVGGLDDDNQSLASVEIYDPTADRWDLGPPLPTPQFDVHVESAGGALHVLLSGTPMLTLNATGDGWDTGPQAPSFVDACVIDDRYVMAFEQNSIGFSSAQITPHFFDTQTGQWQEGTSTTITRVLRFSIACAGSDVYMTGGYRFATFTTDAGVTDGVRRYAAVGGEWSSVDALNQRRESHVSAHFKGRVMVFGGVSGGELRSVEFLRDGGAAWEQDLPMFTPRKNAAAVVLDDRAWVIGGLLDGVALGTVESLDAPDDIFGGGFEDR